ncbi:thermonuclease family protein [Labrenzia sp. PHM005]|uniref:thermonuclease family protein n=1 Tax=Labrenzia sp. PHM005 TaxID=2590016 RepID=UPI0011404AF9|nr:thermonuclease family protein [Labrenzia sp. PHM005]QDG77685.1 thermonuclease family protein [Labrenzia sp. PHM005]
MNRTLQALTAFLLLPVSHAYAAVEVIDGDTLLVNGEAVRLYGIDALEAHQTCKEVRGQMWNCGADATRYLKKIVRGGHLTCERIGQDSYGRTLGMCWVDGVYLNAKMVNAGMAWSFRKYASDYVHLEQNARSAKRGIWQNNNVPAWEFRAKTSQTTAKQQQRCNIKGNISRNGRIYHLPGQKYYSRTRIDTFKGERWFCSEREARSAGWRRSKR